MMDPARREIPSFGGRWIKKDGQHKLTKSRTLNRYFLCTKAKQKRYLQGEYHDLRVPRADIINRYVGAYIAGLHQHLPVLHLPTLDLNEMELPLLLALSGIGALYCFEDEDARKLHSISADLLYEVINLNPSSDELDISMIQTIFFALLFAAWSGERGLFLRHLGLPSILANVCLL